MICKNDVDDMFVTAWFGVLDLDSGILRAVNAGHEKPILQRDGKTFEKIKDISSLPLGFLPGVEYTSYTLQLEPGAKLFVFTDGITDAVNNDEEQFSESRLIEVLNKHKDKSTEQVVESVSKALKDFVGDRPQFDDQTMLCVQYNG